MELAMLFGLMLVTLIALGAGSFRQPQRKMIPVQVRAKDRTRNSKAYDAAIGNQEKLK